MSFVLNRTMSLEDLRLQTGDVILIRKKTTWLEWFQMLGNVPVESIGIIVESPTFLGTNYRGLHIIEHALIFGTCSNFSPVIWPLERRLDWCEHDIYVRLLHTKRTNNFFDSFEEACKLLKSKNNTELLDKNTNGDVMWPNDWHASTIAALLRHVGIWDSQFHRVSRVTRNQFRASDFDSIVLNANNSFSNEIRIIQ